MYVYETDGLGNQLLMDDAGVPGLLSAPYYGYCDKTDPVYRSTRRFSLSPRNPFFYTGKALSGLGSPHSKPDFVWPMGIIMQGFTVQPEENLCTILDMVAHADDGTGYVHESVHKDDPSRYTRPWFAWVNSLYSELLIKTYVKSAIYTKKAKPTTGFAFLVYINGVIPKLFPIKWCSARCLAKIG